MATENVIVTGSNSYWGWNHAGGAAYTYEAWREMLRGAFNSGLDTVQRIGIVGVPGYDQGIDTTSQRVIAAFINVPKLALDIFNYRTRQGSFAGVGP
jgi:hypothetical protein